MTGTTANYAYDNGDKLLSVSIGGITSKSFSYDARGNTTGITTSSGTQSFTYNAEDKPISITAPGLSQTNAFNGAGARTSKVVNGASTSFKRSSPGVTAPLLAAGSSTFNPGISEKQGGVTHTQLSDRLGTLKGTTNSSQSVTSTKQFDAFGNLTSSSGIASLKGFATDYGYQEDENGLKQVGHRLFDPSLGRFLTRDPEGDGLNWYAYCENNPLRYVDPEGLEGLDWLHTSLDIIGIFDPTGISDGLNGLVHLVEGNHLEAGIAFACAVPVGGKFAKGAKLTHKALQKAEAAAKALEKADAAVKARKAAQLEKNIAAGRKAEEQVAAAIRKKGYEVKTLDKFQRTDSGLRKVDLVVKKPGKTRWIRVEVKKGKSRYGGKQRKKDQEWKKLKNEHTIVIRR